MDQYCCTVKGLLRGGGTLYCSVACAYVAGRLSFCLVCLLVCVICVVYILWSVCLAKQWVNTRE